MSETTYKLVPVELIEEAKNMLAYLTRNVSSVTADRAKNHVIPELDRLLAASPSIPVGLTAREADELQRRCAEFEEELTISNQCLVGVSLALGGPSEWAEQKYMIADIERLLADHLSRVQPDNRIRELEAALAEARKVIEFYSQPPLTYEIDKGQRARDFLSRHKEQSHG